MKTRIHPTAMIEANVTVGDGSSIWDHVHIRHDTTIGRDCIIGGKTYIAYGVSIGNLCKINSSVYICTKVTIDDGVMISAGTIFTNDRFPRAADEQLTNLRSSDPDEETESTLVQCGRYNWGWSDHWKQPYHWPMGYDRDGGDRYQSIPDFHLVIGSPARSIGAVCRCGKVLVMFSQGMANDEDHSCLHCGRKYRRSQEAIVES